MNGNYLVYKHTSPSGKIYIGITKRSVHERWENGKGYKKNPHFWKAIEKYGWENIKHEILVDGLEYSDAEYYEKYFIALYQSFNPNYGYNMTYGGDSGLKATDEVKYKISQKLKEYYAEHPEATKEISNRMKGVKRSQLTKKKMSESHIANMTDEHRKKIGDAHRGVKLEYRKRKPMSEDTKMKIRQSKKGKHFGGNGAKSKTVVCVETGVVYSSVSEICKLFGYKFQNIYKSCKTGSKSHGYSWQYADEYTSGKM